MRFRIPKLKRRRLSIARWWLISIIGAFSLVALLSVHAVSLFIDAAGADAVTEGTEAPIESISRDALHEAVVSFEVRVRRFESLKAGYGGVSDPSR